ncbi:MAG: WD40/YVTN/BNR-like repeat-containing protein [Steroidobacterales bacterium]
MKKALAEEQPVRGRSWAAALATVLFLTAAAQAATPHKFLDGKLSWRNIGPNIGGRAVAVAGVPGERNLFYMGSVDGGVWESTDYGVAWHNITDGKWPSASDSVGAIAVAPSNPKVLYVGTGETDIRNDIITGDGVFKSVDAGKTWKYAGLKDTRTISTIAVDPHDPDVVYAASMGHVFAPNPDRGVFKSTDGGKTWQKILFVDDKTGAIDLVMDPRNPKILYATMWQAQRTPWSLDDGGPGSGLYKSTDGGAHWRNLTRNPGLPGGVLGRIGIDVAASNPQIVFAIIQAKDGGVFRSADGGATWQHVNDNWSLRQRAFYYTCIYVDPTNPKTLYVPNVDGVWVSHNGGKGFSLLHLRHGDDHIVWINPKDPKVLLVGTDGGATVSTDGGKTWSSDHNQPTGQFYHVALDGEFPFNVYGAQQDEGSFEGPSAMPGGAITTSAWHEVALGESTFVAPEPHDADVTYGSDYYTLMQRYNRITGARTSVSPWPQYLDGVSAAEMKYRFGWTHPIFFSPDDPKDLFLASQYVMMSDDGGRTWKILSPDLTRNDPATEKPSGGPVDLDQTAAEVFPDISALAVSTVDSHVIWAGSQDGLVHVTVDGGHHWQAVTPPQLTQWAEISSIEPSHTAAGTAYLTAQRYMWDDNRPYVYETTDFGRHWSVLTSGLPDDEAAFVVRQDPSDPSLLFLGTANTVYTSLDGGAHWRPLGLNLPHAQVRDLAINAREGELVAATHGRSFWILDNLALLEQLSHDGQPAADAATLYAPEAAWLTNAYGQSSDAKYSGPIGLNPPFGATVFFHIPAKYNGKTSVSLQVLDDHGTPVRQYTLHLKKKQPKLTPVVRDNLLPSQEKHNADEKLTAISPGINSLRWDLRYADATGVIGFEPPEETDGETADARGPLVNPGQYTVVLRYGDQSSRQTFQVDLDPRLHTTPAALQQHLGLQLGLHQAMDQLDRQINAAIQLRQHLAQAVAAHQIDASKAASALDGLDRAIDAVVQRKVRSSEGDVMNEMRLRSFLAYLQSDIGLSYGAPDPAQVAACSRLESEAQSGEARLEAAAAAGKQVLQGSGAR